MPRWKLDPPFQPGRRAFGGWAAGALMAAAWPALAQGNPRVVLADMHSHYTMFTPDPEAIDFRQQMVETGTTLVAWAIVDDSYLIRPTPQGLKQVQVPAPGDLWEYFRKRVARCDQHLRHWNLPKALVPADVDAALAGEPHIVMASESANFLEARPERVALAHAMGLRHLQIVHYIASPLGDLQTAVPKFNGMPPVALQVIEECRRLGVLVDLAHCTPAFVDEALAQSDATMIWSHSWISPYGGTWRNGVHLARSLSPAQAKKIVAHGGVMGLWTVTAAWDRSYPVTSVNAYADEIMRMVDLLGPQAVAFGTDMDGAGPNPVMSRYGQLREVADRLASRGMPEAVLRDVCSGNYARVLKKAMRT